MKLVINKSCYCVDCNKKLSNTAYYLGSKRCRSCSQKERFKNSQNHPNYKDGRTNKKCFCKDCGIEISGYEARRCRSCAQSINKMKTGKYRTLIYYYCKDCGIKVYRGSIRCNSCATKKKMNNPIMKKHFQKIFSLDRNPAWQGGKSFEKYPKEFSNQLKELIRTRDDNLCILCRNEKYKRKLDIHHIDENKTNNSKNNLVSICRICHRKIHNNTVNLIGDVSEINSYIAFESFK